MNPLVNAIVEDRFEDALEEARAIDSEIAKGVKTVEEMERDTPLLGLPVTVKESIAVKGMINQGGRVFKQKRVAQYDAPCVVLVKKHGGIILLVSNTPELCMCWETYNNVSGQTRNPYDLTRTPGGSSGGEAALISSGASLIGLSSDIAGSARLPAMFTGIYGHKPTPYAISPKGHIPASNVEYWGDFFTIAPMTRYASDLPLLLKCVNDPNGRKLDLDKRVDVNNIKFFYMNNDGPSGTTRRLSKDIKCTIDDVASFFNASKVKINGLKWALEISMSAMLRIKNVETIYYEGEDGEPRKHMGKETLKYFTFHLSVYLCFCLFLQIFISIFCFCFLNNRYLLGMSDSIFPSVLVGPLQQVMHWLPESRHKKLANIAENLKHQFQELLGTNGVFLYPTFPTTAHRHYQIYHKLVDTGYMMVFNTIGLPVTNCMVRLDRHKLPIGIQVR